MKQHVCTLNHGILIIAKMWQTVGNEMLQCKKSIATCGAPAEVVKAARVTGKFTFNQFKHIQINLIVYKVKWCRQRGDCQPRPYDWRCHSSTVLQTAAVPASSNRSACAFPGKNIPYAVSGSGWPSARTAPDYRKNVHHSGIVLAIAAAGSNTVQSAAVNDIPRSE